jgi:hypothetical protein
MFVSWDAMEIVAFHLLLVSVRGVDHQLWSRCHSKKQNGHFVAPDWFYPGEYVQDFIWGYVIRGIAIYQYNICCDDDCGKCRLQSSFCVVASICGLRVLLKDSPPKPCIGLSSPSYVLHSPPISFFSILSPERYLPHSEELSTLLINEECNYCLQTFSDL